MIETFLHKNLYFLIMHLITYIIWKVTPKQDTYNWKSLVYSIKRVKIIFSLFILKFGRLEFLTLKIEYIRLKIFIENSYSRIYLMQFYTYYIFCNSDYKRV